MSRNGVVGDLVPRDVTEVLVLAQQNRCSAGRGRRRGSSLGRAFSWLRPTPRHRSSSTGPNRTAQNRTTETSTERLGLTHQPCRAGPKEEEPGRLTVHYTASQHYQENVFIEGSRPKHLQDLHSEAQEGLKILQQEEHKNGVDYQTDQTNSTVGPWPERAANAAPKEESGDSGSLAANSSTSSASMVSSLSTRPVLTRQGSTFKPLNPVRRPEKSKKRSRRTTIMGIPQQVQRELVMQRATLPQQQAAGDELDIVIIPTIDGETPARDHEGVRVHLQSIEALQASREEQLLRQHIQALYRDDLALAHRAGPRGSLLQRPKSLAVPGLTSSSFLQEPLGPVMSMSPQATYLSTIIPNAILPAAIDVIQIDRSRSVRAVSKSSLTSASPPSSRSGGDTQEPASSSSSHWSHSQSSETIVSNPSTISSRGGTATLTTADSPKEGTDHNSARASTRGSMSSFCSDRKSTSQRLESRVAPVAEVDNDDDNEENVRISQAFSRSLSVVKTKQPPAPPRRTFSLHHEKMKRRPKEVVEVKDLGDMEVGETQNLTRAREGSTSGDSAGSPGHSSSSSTVAEESSITSQSLDLPSMVDHPEPSSSSLQNACTAESKFDRTLSPSSGYSSQSGTPTLSPKEICLPSPEKQKTKPPKPERTGSKASPAILGCSLVASLSSVVSDSVRQESTPSTPPQILKAPAQIAHTTPPQTLKAPPQTAHTTPLQMLKAPPQTVPPPSTVNVRDLLSIPPPPKVKAPSPPPPETWAHNRRTFELLCGQSPNTSKLLQLQKQTQRGTDQFQGQEPPVEHIAAPDPKTPACGMDENVSQLENQESELKVKEDQVPVQTLERMKENEYEPEALRSSDTVAMQVRKQESQDVQKEEACLEVDKQKSPEMSSKDKGPAIPKKEPPPVMKKSIRIKQGQKPEEVKQSIQEHTNKARADVSVCPSPETPPSLAKDTETTSKPQAVSVGKATTERLAPEVMSMESPAAEPSGLISSSPPPSPPPAHQPPPPPSKTSPTPSASPPPPEEEHELLLIESVWPPPPPPLEDLPELAYEGQDELDFPPPPPPPLPSQLEQAYPDASQVEPIITVQEQGLEESKASAADECVKLPFTNRKLEKESKPEMPILENPVTTLSVLPEADQLQQKIMSKADHAVNEVPSGEHLTECFEAMEPLDLCTVPSKDLLQALTKKDDLTQEIPPLSKEIPPPPQEAPPPPPSTTESLPEPSGSDLAELSPVAPSPAHIPTDLSSVAPSLSDIPTDPAPAVFTLALIPTDPSPAVSTIALIPTDLSPAVSAISQIPTDLSPVAPPLSHIPTDHGPVVSPLPHVPTDPSLTAPPLAHVPVAPTSQATMNFRRQSSLLNRENRSKDLLSRNKSVPIPKEDANIPLVTPSLLQMVRLRSVGVSEDQVIAPSPDNTPNTDSTPNHDHSQSPGQAAPQKPIRKSLSLKTGTPVMKAPSTPAPSLRLQEAIRLKTAAMSSRDGLPARLCLRSSMASLHSSSEVSAASPQSSAGGDDMHKSPASTASFIFSKSTKKVVIETPSDPKAQAELKQSLAAELKQVSDQAKLVVANGTNKPAKPPPPVAKKPLHGKNSSEVTEELDNSWGGTQSGAVEANGGVTKVQTASQKAQPTDETSSAGGVDTPNSIEVS